MDRQAPRTAARGPAIAGRHIGPSSGAKGAIRPLKQVEAPVIGAKGADCKIKRPPDRARRPPPPSLRCTRDESRGPIPREKSRCGRSRRKRARQDRAAGSARSRQTLTAVADIGPELRGWRRSPRPVRPRPNCTRERPAKAAPGARRAITREARRLRERAALPGHEPPRARRRAGTTGRPGVGPPP